MTIGVALSVALAACSGAAPAASAPRPSLADWRFIDQRDVLPIAPPLP